MRDLLVRSNVNTKKYRNSRKKEQPLSIELRYIQHLRMELPRAEVQI